MSTTNLPKNTPKTKRATSKCCTDPDCGCGLRNRYFLGKQLSPYSFQVEQRHILERRRLLNRAIHGWGVAYGFEVVLTPSGSLTIKPGLALDENGRELLLTEELAHALGDLIVLDNDGHISDMGKISDPRNGAPPECLVLSAHYAEQDTDAVKVNDPCQCQRMEWNYTCETIRFSLQSKDCTDCCKGQACEWNCKCGSPGWCDQFDDTHQRGGRRHLCDHVTHLAPGSECDKLCEIDEPCGSVRVDLHNGVPLACVKLISKNGDGWAFRDVDACGPRRLVKGNDLLFDLIRGCDLTYIKNYGWKDWHRRAAPVPFSDFADAFGQAIDDEGNYITRDFWVEFSRPVQRKTVRQDCFAMAVISYERDDHWWETFRVPIVRVETADAEYIDRATLVVDGDWVVGAIRTYSSLFQHKATRIELEVRGDFIVDCNGQTIDANAHGLSQGRTGNGTPGGTFLSTFPVEAAPERARERKNEERIKGVS